MKDFYYILGTPSNASSSEIEAAYQKLARKFMDEQDTFMNAHFREISEAYDILRDEHRRRTYDAAFRRSQRRSFAAFRLKYLNIALTLTFLAVTALFAVYVIRSIEGHPKKAVQKAELPPAVIPAQIPVHIKKHHKVMSAHAVKNPAQTQIDSSVKTVASHPPSVPDPTNTAKLHANVTGIVYLHQSPDYGSAVLAKLPDATEVRVLQKGTDWYKVSCNGQEGYVMKSAIEQ